VGGCLLTALAVTATARLPLPVFWLLLSGVLAGIAPGILMAMLPRAVAPEYLATALGIYYGLFYLGMAVTQTAAGALRDLTGDPAVPLLFAALLIAGTVVAATAFWRVEASRAPVPVEASRAS
jgi:MFS family permease